MTPEEIIERCLIADLIREAVAAAYEDCARTMESYSGFTDDERRIAAAAIRARALGGEEEPWSPDLILPPVPGMGIPTAAPGEGTREIGAEEAASMLRDLQSPAKATPAPGEDEDMADGLAHIYKVPSPDNNAKLVERARERAAEPTFNAPLIAELAAALEALRKENEGLLKANKHLAEIEVRPMLDTVAVRAENEALRKECEELKEYAKIAQGNTDAAIEDYNDALARIAELEGDIIWPANAGG